MIANNLSENNKEAIWLYAELFFGSSWWFMSWLVVISSDSCHGLWWFIVMVRGGSWWFNVMVHGGS